LGRNRAELNEKHWQALRLVEEGNLNYKEIAAQIGWSEDHFQDLRAGDIKKCGYTAELFKKEFKKVEVKRDENIKRLVRENTASAQELIKSVLAELKTKKKLAPEEKKLLSMYTNALAKCTPSVSVKSLSYSYTQGLNPEELIHEFKRLKTIAEQSFDRRRVSEPEEGRSGDVSAVDER